MNPVQKLLEARGAANAAPVTPLDTAKKTGDGQLGAILRQSAGLSDEQIQQALAYQDKHAMRFGAALVALGFVKAEEVATALAQQYRYPYSPETQSSVNRELVAATQPMSEHAEAFRDVRSQLLTQASTGAYRALAVVSPDLADGRTFVAANLAVVFSHLPGRTLIIDGNLRRPRLQKLFNVPPCEGLASVLAGRGDAGLIRTVPHLPNLFLLPAGFAVPNPVELLQQVALTRFLDDVARKFDHVLVDTAAAVEGSDAHLVAAHCGAAMVVIRKHNSQAARLRDMVQRLNKRVHLAGSLVNEY